MCKKLKNSKKFKNKFKKIQKKISKNSKKKKLTCGVDFNIV